MLLRGRQVSSLLTLGFDSRSLYFLWFSMVSPCTELWEISGSDSIILVDCEQIIGMCPSHRTRKEIPMLVYHPTKGRVIKSPSGGQERHSTPISKIMRGRFLTWAAVYRIFSNLTEKQWPSLKWKPHTQQAGMMKESNHHLLQVTPTAEAS